MKAAVRLMGSCALIFSLGACAFDLVHIDKQDRHIETQDPSLTAFRLDDDVTVALGSGYRRTLRHDTKWTYVGTLPEGDVFKTNDQILTVEASNVYEAYIVVSSGRLLGFYLPVERAYSPLPKPRDLPLTEIVSQP